MGLYKDADVIFQEAMITAMNSQDKELADTVAWYRAHFDKLPAELMRAILTDEEFFQKALAVWGNNVPAPKRAMDHVALQTRRPRKHATEAQAFRRSIWFLIGLTVIPVAFFVLVAVEVY
jgi:hypothetical protein